jgi:glutamine amidotransferase
MDRLEATGLIPELLAWNKADRPLLGICLGLQLLFESSEEGKCQGLGLLPGRVKQLPNNQGERIPHMGWGKLQIDRSSPLLPDPSSAEWMYFVHSFAAEPQETRDRAASVAFGSGLATAVVWRNRLGACQFHPEKSAVTGQRLLSRWLEWLQQGAPLMP